jgi:polyhydroxybutyrate depolymerase
VDFRLHGYLEDSDDIERISTMTPAADERGVVVVYADGLSLGTWNAGSCCGTSSSNDVDDVGFLGAALDEVLPAYCLDDRRVYAAGFSNGGMLSHRLACEMSDRIAAIGSTAGTLAIPACEPSRPVPIMHTHGTDDGVVEWDGGGLGNARSVEDTIDTWLRLDGCTDAEPTTIHDEGDATCVAWTACDQASEVRLCTIDGGGHQWPGGEDAAPVQGTAGMLSDDLQTSEELLEFFLGFSLPPPGSVTCEDPVDPDCDGIDQDLEDQMARDYLPFISHHPEEECPRGGIVYRARKHPIDPTKVFITYVTLYENDCGVGGHVGDDEVFGVTIDPAVPAPGGILAIKAIGHQGTACEQVTDCGTCEGDNVCDTLEKDGAPYPVVFHSKDKHAGYAHDDCNFFCDNDGCGFAAAPADLPMVNVGEPGARLVDNLTTEGFINAENGWTEQELFDFDPWAPGDFGSAGDVSDDLVDLAFLPDCY